jgi:BirA family biotin operon repressor/biotin-[acetyl-CoA-carboxylase] ligase
MPLRYFKEIGSTNDYIKEYLAEFKENFSGVYTFNQTKGKGQSGITWKCEPEKNIALTICLTDDKTEAVDVSFWTSVVLRNFFEQLTELKTEIKWTNDILIQKKKIVGILIEKTENTYIIGVGINVLQTDFGNLPKASSLYLLSGEKKKFDLHNLTQNFSIFLEKNHHRLFDKEALLREYNAFLFGKDKVRTFVVNAVKQNGIILGTTEDGRLKVEFENEKVRLFRNKEIEFLY